MGKFGIYKKYFIFAICVLFLLVGKWLHSFAVTSYLSRESTYLNVTSSWARTHRLNEIHSSKPGEIFEIHKKNLKNDVRIGLCKAKTNLAFVKTHKTGSTTLATVINRFGFRRNLSFLFNKNNIHGHFTELELNPDRLLPPRCVKDGDYGNYRDYNQVTAHFRLLPNLKQVRKLMPPNAKIVTILRKPRAQFESAFSHFNAGLNMGLRPGTGSPSTLSEDLARFLTNPAFYWHRASGHARWYTKNGQLFDLVDTDSTITIPDEVKQVIRYLDQILDLVLITEYFDESLILLRKLMCWDFEDILYVTQNARADNFRAELTAEQEERMRSWNMADSLLYDHFNRSLWRKIKRYGPAMQRDLARFRLLLEQFQQDCLNKTIGSMRGKWVKPVAANKSIFCEELVDEDYQIEKFIIDRQKGLKSC